MTDEGYKQDILQWIAEGAVFGDSKKDGVVKLEVWPKEIFMERPGMRQQVLVMAHYGDGTVRDVTREAAIKSNVETVAAVGEGAEHAPTAVRPGPAALSAGQSLVAERIGEAALQVRYEGKFVTVPITVLNPEPGFRLDESAAIQFHRRADRLEAQAAQDRAGAACRRRDLPAARLLGLERDSPDAQAGAGVC